MASSLVLATHRRHLRLCQDHLIDISPRILGKHLFRYIYISLQRKTHQQSTGLPPPSQVGAEERTKCFHLVLPAALAVCTEGKGNACSSTRKHRPWLSSRPAGRGHPQRAAGAAMLQTKRGVGTGEDGLSNNKTTRTQKVVLQKDTILHQNVFQSIFRKALSSPHICFVSLGSSRMPAHPVLGVPEPICCQETQNWYHGCLKQSLETHRTANGPVVGVWLSQQYVRGEKLTFCYRASGWPLASFLSTAIWANISGFLEHWLLIGEKKISFWSESPRQRESPRRGEQGCVTYLADIWMTVLSTHLTRKPKCHCWMPTLALRCKCGKWSRWKWFWGSPCKHSNGFHI